MVTGPITKKVTEYQEITRTQPSFFQRQDMVVHLGCTARVPVGYSGTTPEKPSSKKQTGTDGSRNKRPLVNRDGWT